MTAQRGQPLAGVRVIDCTHDWAGPHAARVLADYGAEVIKIEYQKRLDGMRGGYLDRINSHPRWWEINRNKRGITLDLHIAKHVEAVKALLATADVLIENSRPGVMDRFGLGYDEVRRIRPDIVYVAMSAHGATGPESSYAGYGGALEALSGVQSFTAYEPGGEPLRIREVDVTNGVMGACAVMTALIHRQQTGDGQYVDLSQREASTWLIGERVLAHSAGVAEQPVKGNRHPVHAPQGCYRCRGDDRWLVLTVRSDREWRLLCEAASQPELAGDARFTSVEGRSRHHDEIDRRLEQWTVGQDAAEAMMCLQARGIAAGMVANVADLAADPHLAARGWFQHLPGSPDQRYPGFPLRFARGGGALHRRGPDLGADNRALLCGEVGWTEGDLPDLSAERLGTAFDPE